MSEPPAPPSLPRHPPFTSLRAVEAAVRNGNYSAAARELQISHAAISQSIKRLETEFGLKLFERNGQNMEPSEIAIRMAAAYSEARNTIYKSLGEIIERPAPLRAVVAMPSDFGRFWFAPRIDLLSKDNMGLTIEIQTASADLVGASGVDICLGSEPVALPDWKSEHVADIILFPVCSPDFQKRQGLRTVRDLTEQPLLAEKRWPWSLWLDAVGQKRARVHHHLMFDDANVTLDAAVRGHGIALAHIFNVEEHLRKGLLVAPLRDTATTSDRLYLSWCNSNDPRIEKLATWLVRALRASADMTMRVLPVR